MLRATTTARPRGRHESLFSCFALARFPLIVGREEGLGGGRRREEEEGVGREDEEALGRDEEDDLGVEAGEKKFWMEPLPVTMTGAALEEASFVLVGLKVGEW